MKQRLVGAIVLGCLAIIFIPIILDGAGVTPAQMPRTIPPSPISQNPTLLEVPEIEPVRPVILADTDELNLDEAQQETPSAEPSSDLTASAVEDRPGLNVQGLPESWSVRLASFGESANAEALITRLLTDSYKGYSRPISSSQGPLTAVYVGPVQTQTEAAQLKLELDQKFELSSIVVQFTIDELPQ